jgi:hypothetical protein
MRKPNADDLSDDVVDPGGVGDGFGGVVDLSEGYGRYDDNFDDYDTDESSVDDDSSDDSFSDDQDADDEPSFGSDVTEAEAEDILADMLEGTYGQHAGEVVEDLEEATGMSATEILEDISGSELDGNQQDADASDAGPDGGVGSIDPFGAPDEDARPSDFDVSD